MVSAIVWVGSQSVCYNLLHCSQHSGYVELLGLCKIVQHGYTLFSVTHGQYRLWQPEMSGFTFCHMDRAAKLSSNWPHLRKTLFVIMSVLLQLKPEDESVTK